MPRALGRTACCRMPLIAFAVLAYAVGLAAGYLGASIAAILLGAGCAALAAVKRHRVHAAFGALLVAGACIAMYDAAHDARCRSEAPKRSQWSAQLEDAAAPGAYVRAVVRWPGCAMPASMSVERGRAAAGDRVSIAGTVFVTARGLKIAHARITPDGARDLLLVARAAIGARIDTLFRGDAPLVRALLIADERAVDPAVRDRFAVSGIVHMLSISGLHVAIIAMAVELLCRMARLRPATASIATLAITAAYVAVIGLPAPAVRSGVMLGVRSLCKLLQRPTSPWAALALGAAAPLVAPAAVLDLGYQLSVLGMAALVASGALAKRVIPGAWTGVRASLSRTLLTSCVACCASAPLVAWTFGRISLVAPITNILATPVVAVLQPALFLAVAISPVRALGMLLADAVSSDASRTRRHCDGRRERALRRAHCRADARDGDPRGCREHRDARRVRESRAGACARGRGRCAHHRGVAAALAIAHRRDGAPHDRRRTGRCDRAPHAGGRWLLFDAGRDWTGGDAGRVDRDPVPPTPWRRRDAVRALAPARGSRRRRRERDRSAPSGRVLGRCVRGDEPTVPRVAHRGARCGGGVASCASGRLARRRRRAPARARAGFRVDGRAQGSQCGERRGARGLRRGAHAADGGCGKWGGGAARGGVSAMGCARTCSRSGTTEATRAARRAFSRSCGRGSRSSRLGRGTCTGIRARACCARLPSPARPSCAPISRDRSSAAPTDSGSRSRKAGIGGPSPHARSPDEGPMARFGTCTIHRAGATLHLLRPRGRPRHEVTRGSTYAYVRRHDRPLHHRAGAPVSRRRPASCRASCTMWRSRRR